MDDRRRDGGTNCTLRTKEQGTHLTLNEYDDDNDDDDDDDEHGKNNLGNKICIIMLIVERLDQGCHSEII